jgi:acyl-CoA synthetase (NDP forming)
VFIEKGTKMKKEIKQLIEGRESLAENEVKDVLRAYDIPVTNYQVMSGEEEVAKLKLNFPVALKVCSPKILHKTDVGGVELNLKNKDELTKSIKEFEERFPKEKFLVEEMMPGGTEVIMGLIRDPTFDLSIMVGIGGIFTEIYKDVSFRVLPIERKDAEQMIGELKGKALLEGFRGIKRDKEAVIDLLLNLSKLGQDLNEYIDQMDLNPVFVYEKGLAVVDAKLLLKKR